MENIYFYLFIFIYFKNNWDILEWKLVNKNVPKYLLALQDPLKSLFTGPKPFWGIFTGLGP